MSNLKKLEITPCDFYDSSRLWGTEKYTLNNMLLHDVNFPSFFYQEDIVFSQYSDRIPYKDMDLNYIHYGMNFLRKNEKK